MRSRPHSAEEATTSETHQSRSKKNVPLSSACTGGSAYVKALSNDSGSRRSTSAVVSNTWPPTFNRIRACDSPRRAFFSACALATPSSPLDSSVPLPAPASLPSPASASSGLLGSGKRRAPAASPSHAAFFAASKLRNQSEGDVHTPRQACSRHTRHGMHDDTHHLRSISSLRFCAWSVPHRRLSCMAWLYTCMKRHVSGDLEQLTGESEAHAPCADQAVAFRDGTQLPAHLVWEGKRPTFTSQAK